MDAKGAQALQDRIWQAIGRDGRYEIRAETEKDAADLTRLLGVTVLVGDRVSGRVTVTDR